MAGLAPGDAPVHRTVAKRVAYRGVTAIRVLEYTAEMLKFVHITEGRTLWLRRCSSGYTTGRSNQIDRTHSLWLAVLQKAL